MLKISFGGSWKEIHGCEASSVQPWRRGSEPSSARGRWCRAIEVVVEGEWQAAEGDFDAISIIRHSKLELQMISR